MLGFVEVAGKKNELASSADDPMAPLETKLATGTAKSTNQSASPPKLVPAGVTRARLDAGVVYFWTSESSLNSGEKSMSDATVFCQISMVSVLPLSDS